MFKMCCFVFSDCYYFVLLLLTDMLTFSNWTTKLQDTIQPQNYNSE